MAFEDVNLSMSFHQPTTVDGQTYFAHSPIHSGSLLTFGFGVEGVKVVWRVRIFRSSTVGPYSDCGVLRYFECKGAGLHHTFQKCKKVAC